ncbi:hypothetical protein AGMMS50218_06120 [Actinomycetota bacterium]|nr:hypothetical protein AGMMS50218_06120 [Actinomycetota bacterium]
MTDQTTAERPAGARSAIRDLLSPPVVVDPDTPCEAIDRGFRSGWTVSSVLVRPRAEHHAHGIIGRQEFLATMTGRYGFGRSIWARRPVADIASWHANQVDVGASLTEAAALLTDGASGGYADIVVTDADGVPLGILEPTTLMEALAGELAQQAARDHLTGVASRATFVTHLRDLCRRARRGHGAVVLAFIDLDRLKEVNDTLGHGFGDALLTSVARRLGQQVKAGDVLGRLGGDEFAVARFVAGPGLPSTGGGTPPAATWADHALTLGEDLRRAVAAGDPDLPLPAHSRASVGLSIGSGEHLDHDQLLREADTAMYVAKKAGGDRVRLAGVDEITLRHRLDTDRLDVYYQPIVAAGDGHVDGVEALLRRRRTDGAVEGPEPTLTRAARDGLSVDLDLWVLARACADMADWCHLLGERAPGTLNVNLSPETLRTPALAARLLAVIDAAGVERSRVRVELPEAATEDEMRHADRELRTQQQGGVRIALDDMGSALSSLRHVSQLPVDVLKIDRDVVAGMLSDSINSMIVTILQHVATDRGLTVVAEGVEDDAQLAALRTAGVDMVQGFLLARPMPVGDVAGFLRAAPPAPPVPA